MVLLLQILLGKTMFCALTFIRLCFPRLFLGGWVMSVLVSSPCLRVRMGRANKGDFSSPTMSHCFFFSMEKNQFLNQKRSILLHAKE